MRRLARLLRMDGADRRLLLRCWLCLLVVRVSLSTLPFRTVRHAALPRASRRSMPSVERVAWAVGVTSRYVPRATCLTQALAAQWLLADPEVSLRVGVQRGSARPLEAHAWLEYRGRIIIGEAERGGFVAFPPLPDKAR